MTSLFNDDVPHNDPVVVDPNKNYLEDLVGDGKKFKTVEELARGKAESDAFVEHMKREQNQLREDYMKLREEYHASANLREMIDQISKQKQSPSNDSTDVNDDNIKAQAFDPKQIESLVSSKLSEYETQKKELENYNLVKEKLVERFGPNFKEALRQHSEAMGMTSEYVDDLARRAPVALLKALGLDAKSTQKDTFQAPTPSSVKTTFTPKMEQRTWSYYQKLRRENPKQYYDPKTQVQLHKDAIDLGPAFEDGDWEQLGKL